MVIAKVMKMVAECAMLEARPRISSLHDGCGPSGPAPWINTATIIISILIAGCAGGGVGPMRESRIKEELAAFMSRATEVARASDPMSEDWYPMRPSDDDVRVLRAAHINPDSLDPTDRIILADVVRIAGKLQASDMPVVVRYATENDGQMTRAFALMVLLHGEWDGAADLMVRYSAHVDRERRYYAMWKWMQVILGERPDRVDMGRNLQLALLRCFERGGLDQRMVIAELFGRKDEAVMRNDLATLRQELAK